MYAGVIGSEKIAEKKLEEPKKENSLIVFGTPIPFKNPMATFVPIP